MYYLSSLNSISGIWNLRNGKLSNNLSQCDVGINNTALVFDTEKVIAEFGVSRLVKTRPLHIFVFPPSPEHEMTVMEVEQETLQKVSED